MTGANPGGRPVVDEARAAAAATPTIVIGAYPRKAGAAAGTSRSPEARIDEAAGLARAIDLDVLDVELVLLGEIRPATYLGKGKVDEIAAQVKEQDVRLVSMDCALSPVQQRNLERAWDCKVIDRTGLILEIFGRRARTKEGALQVELAHLTYQRSRLVRSWTHLERQRGGFGFLGGPGETQIEIDRRLIQERISRIERDLEAVKKTRALHRASRRRTPYPIAALVGYTNAGKSTLFNRLAKSDVFAEDLLFATLDPTARAIKLPHGSRIILSDTVGFISDLPTMLVAAFRATLEDVVEANIILHVRDVAHEDSDAQAADVESILRELGVAGEQAAPLIEVWNKIDLMAPEARDTLIAKAAARGNEPAAIAVSALTGEGADRLLGAVEQALSSQALTYVITLSPEDGRGVSWLHERTEVLDRRSEPDGRQHLVVRVAPERRGRFEAKFPGARLRQ
ncbi:GTPase HflX [Terrarubrum flagellatum]|uniref:GTPase HflX n=1 Tax=Terrirubrum flagellatum TaxID=2895980 RepID=UPI0031456656